MGRTARPLAWCLGMIIAVTAACGVPVDTEPRALSDVGDVEAVDGQQPSGSSQTWVYLTLNEELVPTIREVPAASPAAVLNTLLAPPSEAESAAGLVTQIPEGTEVLSVEQNDTVLRVNLSAEFEDVIGASRQLAIGQIVLTVTELTGISEVTFQIDGDPQRVSSPVAGDVVRVSDCDYLPLIPTAETIQGSTIAPDASAHLLARRQSLAARCPLSDESAASHSQESTWLS
jgi:hypothetical protein